MTETALTPMAEESVTTPSYLDFARSGRSSGWLYLGGFASILTFWLFASAIMLVPFILTGVVDESGEFKNWPVWASNLVTLLTFIPLLVATPLVVRWFHGRPWRSVITPFTRINWKIIALGALIWGGLLIVTSLGGILVGVDSVEWAFEPSVFIPNAIVCTLLLFFQTSAEELLFRGYLPQWLALLTRNRLIQSTVIGLAFTIPHMLNPEVVDLRGWEYLLGITNYFLVGFFLAWVSITSGTIELALGAHFINNWLSSLLVSYDNSVLGNAGLFVFTTDGFVPGLVELAVAGLGFILITWKIKGSGVPAKIPPKAVSQPTYYGGYGYPPPVPYPVQYANTYASNPPPGWYLCPWFAGTWRWYDGANWTPYTAPQYV